MNIKSFWGLINYLGRRICFRIAWDTTACSKRASQRFSLVGSPNNGPLSFFILTFVVISLLLGVYFFLLFIYVLLCPSILRYLWKRSRLSAFVLIETDPLPESRRTIRERWSLPEAVVLCSQEQHTVEGNISRISDKRQMFSLSPSSTCSDIH